MSGDPTTDPLATRTAPPRSSAGAEGTDETLADSRRIDSATSVGRFTILYLVGAGGMGQVYAAYDPQLDRRVALKLLHTPDDEVATRRLVREAQALARLSHPNVVAVHEAGSQDGRVFVAMEFVEGETLKAWARANPPGETARLRRALELLLHAAHGLAAAHAAGLVHRDVKPGNILVGRDGRVRVVDFGLARADGEAPPRAPLDTLSSSESDGGIVGTVLTRTGAIAGTPAYMAPEQLTAEPISAATDQFGFCVMAWEVLFGSRPFEPGSIVALLQAIVDGRMRRPDGIEVPPAVESALRTGLAPRPKRRHRSIGALITVLDEELRRLDGQVVRSRGGRRWLAFGVAGVAMAAAVGAWSLHGGGPSCRPDPSSFAGVWDDSRRAAIESAVLGTDAVFAKETWTRLAPAIDAWRDEWLAAHTDACEATHVRGTQSSELLDLRMQCLRDGRMRLAAFVDVLAEGRLDTIAEADDAFTSLPRIDRCADADHLRRTSSRPDDPELAARVDAVEKSIAEADARLASGDYEIARSKAEQAVAQARELAHDRTQAHAQLLLGKIQLELQRADEAESELASAYLLARRADDRDTAAEAARLMVIATGVMQLRLVDGHWWSSLAEIEAGRANDDLAVPQARTAAARLRSAKGDPRGAAKDVEAVLAVLPAGEARHDLLRARTLLLLADFLESAGQTSHSIDVLGTALRIMVSQLGPSHPALARAHVHLARAHRISGDLRASEREIDAAREIVVRALGPHHVLLRPVLDERADLRWARGDLNGTLEDLRRARELHVPQPLRPLTVAMLLAREGNTWLGANQPERAEPLQRQALQMLRDELGDRHWLTARQRIALAAALVSAGRRAEAEVELRHGLALGEELLGREHPEIAVVHDEISLIRERAGDLEGALEHALRGREIVMKTRGADSIEMLRWEGNLCAINQKLGRAAEAVARCEAGIAISEKLDGIDPGIVADLKNNFGAALVGVGRLDEAAEAYQHAHDVWMDRLGAESLQVGIALANIAEVRERTGASSEARALYQRSLDLREPAASASHPSLVVPLLGLARVSLAEEDVQGALASARRAVGICEANPTPPLTLAHAREQLALALARSGQRKDALQHARRALEAIQAAGPEATEDEARIRAWVDTMR